ncbi:MFS transporter [Bordetella genomosp. 9]|uniref:MFS transporter n=1 Tax=Bordetella genomosp. 9 TaxID=1416803 RepID=UPI000A294CB8|nr:MFS transporter [Bordetella genomosp. 9]ARP90683.1 MFS transporter [Bordetella genomosp. 9]
MGLNNRGGVVLALGVTQTIAWASSYYLPAVLAAPMARDLGIGVPTVFAAFSFGLLISAVIGPYAGRAIDRAGGKPTLIATNIVFALGLAGLGWAQGVAGLFAAWALLGLGMGAGLYEAAFAALVALYGKTARNAISGITLIAGFASTVGWPLSSYLDAQIGWRGACFTWAAVHVLLALPLNALLPAAQRATAQAASPDSPENGHVPPDAARNAVLLSIVFAITWFISTAMAAHLPRLLMAAGASFAAAVAAGTLVGPAQVGGRLLELGVLRRIHPLLSARLAATAHPLGAAILLALGAPWASLFVLMHGAGNGIMTIAKGTLPLVLFGSHGYGAKQGVLMVPTRIAQAFAPWLFGLCLDRWGAGALWVSAGLGAVGFLALMALRSPAAEAPEPQDSRLPT